MSKVQVTTTLPAPAAASSTRARRKEVSWPDCHSAFQSDVAQADDVELVPRDDVQRRSTWYADRPAQLDQWPTSGRGSTLPNVAAPLYRREYQ